MAGVSSQLPPGFRFHPTDEELVMHYLCRKCASQSIPVQVIAEIDLYKYAPWELPELALYGEKEWYFFSPRERKYPNGSRPNRAAGSGYWKATGVDKPIGRPNVVAIKKALVFYSGKAPRGEKTNWIMHEYRLAHIDRSPRNNNYSLRLDDWVLCRLYNKKGATGKQQQVSSRKMTVAKESTSGDGTKPVMLTSAHQFSPEIYDDFAYLDASDSIPRQNGGLSCSEHVLSPEVESMKLKLAEWEKATLHLSFNYIDATEPVGGGTAVELMDPQFRNSYQTGPVSNMFGYISNI